jgi:tRNA G18 (ribose-2'-O)-methylase SpoU
MATGEVVAISGLDDPRVAAYRNLKDHELAALDGRFIAEGELVVRRLLESGWAVESVLLADRRADEISPLVPPGVPVYVAPAATVNQIVGFRFHSGVMAVGRRRQGSSLDEAMAALPPRATLVALPEITNTDNMGALLRISAAFGAAAVLIGERCCDPFYRQAVRVSMGSVFQLRLVRCADIAVDLLRLRDEAGVELVATVLDESAQPLTVAGRSDRMALLLGSEGQGLAAQHAGICNRRVTIPMRLGTDSLNVAVAAAVCLYHFTHVVGAP